MEELKIKQQKKFLSIDLNNLDKLRKLEFGNMFSLIDSILKGKYFKNKRSKNEVNKPNKSFKQNFFEKIIKDRINRNKKYFLFNNNSYYNNKITKDIDNSKNSTEKKENKNNELFLNKTCSTKIINSKRKTKYKINQNSQNRSINSKLMNNFRKNKSFSIKYKIINSNNINKFIEEKKLNKSCKEIRNFNTNYDKYFKFGYDKIRFNYKNKNSSLKKEKIINISPIIAKKIIEMNNKINYNIKGFQKSSTDFFHTRNICDIDYQNYYTKREINLDDIFYNHYKNKRNEYKSSKIPFYFYSKTLLKPFNLNKSIYSK